MILRNLSRIDLNLLHIFAAIYQESSITRAAEALNLSQPAVSNSLAKLRDIFGDPLFVRTANGVAPTPLAHRLAGPVREALSALQLAFGTHEAFDPEVSRRIMCFSMSDFAEAVLLSPLIGEISRLGSRIEVQNHFVSEREINTRLASGELDFAVESHPLEEPGLNRALLIEDAFVCVVRRDHPVLSGPWSLERYLALDHLHISNRPRHSNMVDGALAKEKLRRKVTVHIEHCLAVGAILASSDLCVTIPRVFIDRHLSESGFSTLPCPFAMTALQTWLYWHPATVNSAAHGWVRDTMLRLAGAVPSPRSMSLIRKGNLAS
ncbi:LysR family transcriptional regulator [Corticibacterium sp. UT-5YL-CI-8]|nr:LysR family transcriptional regulator [Tianweitania sp. UT-5YL-CI-8]